MAWYDTYLGGSQNSAVTGDTGGRTYSSGGPSSGGGSVYRPSAAGPDGGTPGSDTPEVGRVHINPLAPSESAKNALGPVETLLTGLKDALVGTTNPDVEGSHGGILGVGNVPGMAFVRGAVEGVGTAASEFIAQPVAEAATNVLEGVGGLDDEQMDAIYQPMRERALQTEKGREILKGIE